MLGCCREKHSGNIKLLGVFVGRVTVKETVHVPLNVAYRCSKCGNINYTQHIVSETREASRYGTLATSKNINEMKEASLEYSKEAMGRRLTKIFEEAKEHKYRSAEFNLTCSQCGNMEPWSKMRYKKFETILGVFIPLVAMLAFLTLVSNAFVEFAYIAGGYGLILGLWFTIKYLHRNAMENQISKLSLESLPSISLSEIELSKVDHRS